MSCHRKGGNYGVTSLASAVTGAGGEAVSDRFHALQQEGRDAGAQPPTREELGRFVDRAQMQARHEPRLGRTPATERRRERIMADLEVLRTGPVPTGPRFHAMTNLTAAACPAGQGPAAASSANAGDREPGTACGVQTPSGPCARTVLGAAGRRGVRSAGGTCGVRHAAAWDDTAGAWTDASTGRTVEGPPPADLDAARAQAPVARAGGYPAYHAPEILSHTSATAFDSCGEGFRLTYLEGVPRDHDAGGQALVVGIAVHEAAEHLMALPPHERTPDAASAAFDRALRGDEVTGLTDDGVASARTAWGDYLAMRDPKAVDAVAVEARVAGDFGGSRITGSIDLLVRDPDGVLTVEDLKTGRAPWDERADGPGPGEVAGRPHPSKFVQLITYARLAEQQGLGRVGRVRLFHPKDGRSIEVDLDGDYGRGVVEHAEAFHRRVRAEMDRATVTGDFSCCATPRARRWCQQASKHPPLP